MSTGMSLTVDCGLTPLPYNVDIVSIELRRTAAARPFAFATAAGSSAHALFLGGLVPSAEYWLSCRAHNGSASTEVSGWGDATAPFACRTGTAAVADEAGRRGKGMAGWEARWMYRVSEDGRADPDLLQNHNAGDLVGEAGFLSDSIDYVPYRRADEPGFFTAPEFPKTDPCMSALNASCLGAGDACMQCAAREIGTASSPAAALCSMDASKGRWWGDIVPRSFCGSTGFALFDFQRTPVTRYCVRYTPLGVGFARYLSCNAPEADRYGNDHRQPLCICACYADRVIAKGPIASIDAECGGGAPYFDEYYPQCNCSATSQTALPPPEEDALRYIGMQPVVEPYYLPATPPEAGWPPAPAGGAGLWFSLPIGGACNGSLAEAVRAAGRTRRGGRRDDEPNCTWERPHHELHRIVYGLDLLAHGWRAQSSYDEPTGERVDLTEVVASNAAALGRAFAALDDVLSPQSCQPGHDVLV